MEEVLGQGASGSWDVVGFGAGCLAQAVERELRHEVVPHAGVVSINLPPLDEAVSSSRPFRSRAGFRTAVTRTQGL